MANFGEWLRRHRKNLGILQSDVAKRAGVSTSYISTLERDQPHSVTGAKLTPERDKVAAIAKAVNGDVNEALMLNGYAPLESPSRLTLILNDNVSVIINDARELGGDDMTVREYLTAFQMAYQMVKSNLESAARRPNADAAVKILDTPETINTVPEKLSDESKDKRKKTA